MNHHLRLPHLLRRLAGLFAGMVWIGGLGVAAVFGLQTGVRSALWAIHGAFLVTALLSVLVRGWKGPALIALAAAVASPVLILLGIENLIAPMMDSSKEVYGMNRLTETLSIGAVISAGVLGCAVPLLLSARRQTIESFGRIASAIAPFLLVVSSLLAAFCWLRPAVELSPEQTLDHVYARVAHQLPTDWIHYTVIWIGVAFAGIVLGWILHFYARARSHGSEWGTVARGHLSLFAVGALLHGSALLVAATIAPHLF